MAQMGSKENSIEGDRSDKHRIMVAGVVVVTLLYCLLWFADYGSTALGESPALDNRQTLELAQSMAEGELSAEPFHRAPLYPYLLSLFLDVGLPFERLALVARLINALALAMVAGCTSLVALRLWGRVLCGWSAGLLVALNPMLLFFSGDAFDIILAMAPFMLAVVILQEWIRGPDLGRTLAIGVLLALGAALRSHFLPLALLWPIVALYYLKKRRWAHGVVSVIPFLLSFLMLGWANYQLAGEFRMLPWQGAYNLWAGNSPDASGRIYAQQIRVEFGKSYDNPAKLESIALYERETGAKPPHSIDEMNAYWRGRFIDRIRLHPLKWLGLMGRKAYYFLNSYEQYDNKTYGFHKQRHGLLRWNPIHWGGLLLLAVAGSLMGLGGAAKRPMIISFILIFALYAAGTILFYTSNRFRLPMIPVLACLGGGVLVVPSLWRQVCRPWKLALVPCLLLASVIAYSGFFNARDKNTWEEDYALLANAALRTNRDEEALENAQLALGYSPGRQDMLAVIAQVHFNQWALVDNAEPLNRTSAAAFLEEAQRVAREDESFMAISGIYLWKLGRKSEAVVLWEETKSPLSALCLLWVGERAGSMDDGLNMYRNQKHFQLLQAGIKAKRNPRLYPDLVVALDVIFEPVE